MESLETNSNQQQDFSNEKRKRLKVRRRYQKPFSKQKLVCFLDTNVLLDDLNNLKAIVLKSETNSIFRIIIPWIVLQELDSLKKNADKARDTANAIKFVNEQLKTRKLVRGDRPSKKAKNKDFLIQVLGNDDHIINCCLVWKNTNNSENHRIILLTRDINLQNKAIVHDIEAMSIADFSNKFIDKTESSKSLESSEVLPKRSLIDKSINQSCSEENDRPSKILRGESNKFASSSTSYEKNSISITKTEESTPSKIVSSSITCENDSTEIDLDLKYRLEQALIKLIQLQIHHSFGPDGMKDIIPKFNAKNATLFDCLLVLKRKWFGVFSDCFNRSKTIEQLLSDLTGPNQHKTSQAVLNDNYKFLLRNINAACDRFHHNKE